ncbi:MAG: glycerophosphodiester phosphodiesterase [Haloferacaceae archaeon]
MTVPVPRPGAESDVDVIAHRGFAGRHPENTLAAFRAAVPDADWVELDVLPTADGTPVVFHDDRLGARDGGGLTDASGVVWETLTDVVTGAEVLGSGETVPPLAAVVAAVPAEVGLHVELKNPGTAAIRPDEALDGDARDRARERWAPFVDRVLDVLADVPHDVCYSSFCEGALAAVRARSAAPVAPLTRSDPGAALTVAERYDAAAVHPHWSLVVSTPDAAGDGRPESAGNESEEPPVDSVARAHDAGRAVNAWTVDTRSLATRLRAAGVDGIIADVPGVAPRR